LNNSTVSCTPSASLSLNPTIPTNYKCYSKSQANYSNYCSYDVNENFRFSYLVENSDVSSLFKSFLA